ncbi:hypothetical protein BC829DRAFT_380613 [Chytridium lagenaria]|nr:hypothetical protein BC829DRAFT_380613 [Chytridium lagenaria]
MIPSTSQQSNYRSSILITLNIVQAKGLLAKDKTSGSSNPYAVVYTPDGLVFQSAVVVGDLNPSFSLTVTFPIKDLTEFTTVAIWNRTSPSPSAALSAFVLNNATSDAFLGMVTLSHSELASSAAVKGGAGGGERVECWKLLEKRSSKSNVSGSVLVTFEPTIKERITVQQLYATAFRTVPPDPVPAFYALFSRLVEDDCNVTSSANNRILSPTSKEILGIVAASWRIHSLYPSVIYFDIITELFSLNTVDAMTLYNEAFLDAVEAVNKAIQDGTPIPCALMTTFTSTCQTLHTLLTHHITTFFDQPASALFLPTQASSTSFRYHTIMIEHLLSHPVTGIPAPSCPPSVETQRLVAISFAGRYHGVCALARERAVRTGAEAGKTLGTGVLAEVVLGLAGELKAINALFDELFFGKVHIPTIATSVFLENLMPQLEGFARTYGAVGPDLEEVIELYRAVQTLERICEGIDYRYLQMFKICEWFRPFMKDWLKVSESKIALWVQNAIRLDNFSQLVELGASSSVLDIFTSFQQQIDFLIKLGWPDPEEQEQFVNRLLQVKDSAYALYKLLL